MQGGISAFASNSSSMGMVQLETPMLRTRPSLTSFSISRQVSIRGISRTLRSPFSSFTWSLSCSYPWNSQAMGQCNMYISIYSNWRSLSERSKAGRTCSGLRKVPHNLVVTKTSSRGTLLSRIALPSDSSVWSIKVDSVSYADIALKWLLHTKVSSVKMTVATVKSNLDSLVNQVGSISTTKGAVTDLGDLVTVVQLANK